MAIEFRNVYFHYPNGYLANENLNFKIARGEKTGIIGQNGAGKTTAVKLMNRLYKPTQGDVLVNGINTREKTTAQIAKYVGYVFQNPDEQIFNNTVSEEVQYMLKKSKLPQQEIKKRSDHALELTGLMEFKKKNPYDLPLPVRKFLTIAAVIATGPEYIILDEPTAGLDIRGIQLLENMINLLQQDNISVITISHNMEFVAQNFSRIIVMAHKNIIMDAGVVDVFSNEKIIKEAGIKKPEIALIAEAAGIKSNILYVNDLVKIL